MDTTKRWEDDHSLNDLDNAYTNTLLAYVRESVANYLTTPRFSPRNVYDENDIVKRPPDPGEGGSGEGGSGEQDYLQQATLETVKREDEAVSTLSRILLAGMFWGGEGGEVDRALRRQPSCYAQIVLLITSM